MNRYSGQCECGAVTLTICLPQLLTQYEPRACDCDFCQSRNISYLSDPQGEIEIHAQTKLQSLQQGSNQARFLCCGDCSVVVAGVHEFSTGLKGALNANLLDDRSMFKSAQPVSPKLLEPSEKLARWNKVWSHVTLREST